MTYMGRIAPAVLLMLGFVVLGCGEADPCNSAPPQKPPVDALLLQPGDGGNLTSFGPSSACPVDPGLDARHGGYWDLGDPDGNYACGACFMNFAPPEGYTAATCLLYPNCLRGDGTQAFFIACKYTWNNPAECPL